MLYKVVSGATLVIASLSILAQIVLLPLIFQYSVNIKNDFQARMRKFHHNARTFDNQLGHIRKLDGGVIGDGNEREHHRFARQLQQGHCPPPRPGPPGPPGDPAFDGEQGDPGADGASGMDAYQLLLEEAQKCVECPAGPIGPIGAPGPQGYTGLKGDKGEPGSPGKDGTDGEQGEEGFTGRRGTSGKPGRKGVDGAPAPGGQGAPGPIGVKGSVGPTGAQGERGKRNYVIGQPGADGRPGKGGLDGVEGKSGQRGEKGEKGEPGADARFCPCPIELNMSGGKQKSHLTDGKAIAHAVRSHTPPVASLAEKRPADILASIDSGPKAVEQKLEIQPIPTAERKSTPQVNLPAPDQPQAPGPSAPAGHAPAHNSDPNLAYEDVYPNYDGEKAKERERGRGASPRAEEKPEYDEDTPDSGVTVDGENQGHHAAIHEGENEDGNDNTQLHDLDSQGPPEAGSQRRFVYVTKRPRPGVVSN